MLIHTNSHRMKPKRRIDQELPTIALGRQLSNRVNRSVTTPQQIRRLAASSPQYSPKIWEECGEAIERTRAGRCNRREFGDGMNEAVKACSTPLALSDANWQSVRTRRVGGASLVQNPRLASQWAKAHFAATLLT